MEKDVTITCRSSDKDLVSQAAESAAKEFEEAAGWKLSYNVTDGLSDERSVSEIFYCFGFFNSRCIIASSGGIIVTGFNGRIKVNNTIEERLRLLEEKVKIADNV